MNRTDAPDGKLSLFRSRDFALLWLGGLASYTGLWAMLIALPLFVFQQTGSTLASGAILTAQFAPMLFTSAAGVLVDRWNRQRTLVVANLAMTALTLPLLIPAQAGATPANLWIVYVSVILVAVSGLVVGPAENALLPTLVKPHQLLAANSMNALNDNLARIVGPAIGGAIAAFVGITGVVVLNAVSYATAAILIALIRLPARGADPTSDPVTDRPGFTREWMDGLHQVRGSRPVMIIFVVTAVVLLGDSMFTALLAPFAHQEYADAAVVLGFLAAARGIGGLLGGLITGPVGRLLSVPHRLGGTALIAAGLLAVFVLVPRVPVTLATAALLGVVAVAWSASIQTSIQSNVPNRYLGRVFGSLGTTNAATMTIGSALAAGAGDEVGVRTVLLVAAGLYAASGVVTYLTFPREPAASVVNAPR